MITFHHIIPECIDFLPPQARIYLDKAASHPPSDDIDASQMLQLAKHGYVRIYLVMNDGALTGAVALSINKTLDILLLGGERFMAWKDAFWGFCTSLMGEYGCETCIITGRKGFTKVFPRLKPIGVVYEYRITKES